MLISFLVSALIVVIVIAGALWGVPSHTVAQNMAGTYIPDGWPSKIALNNKPNINFAPIKIRPPGQDGGDPIKATSMQNLKFRTQNPPTLKTILAIEGTAKYDPDVYIDVDQNLNVNQSITYYWPDGSFMDFFGWLRKWEPQECEEAKLPEARFTIEVSNYDPAAHVEQGPVFTAAPGT